MKSRVNLLTLTASLATGLLLMPYVVAEDGIANSRESEPEKFALMIGIDDYETSPLEGCENDSVEIKKLLVSKFGFKDDGKHIKVLLNKQATKQGIVQAFKDQLIENAKKNPDAIFFLQYSGHGSQVPDEDGDEADGLDETLCPADVTMDGKNDLTDDEIGALLAEMTEATANLTMLMDCCHSGTNDREKTFKARRLDRPQLIAKVDKAKGEAAKEDAKPLIAPNKRFVVFTGCMPNELSLETEVDGKKHGLLSYNFMTALQSGSSTMTNRELWSRAATAVNKTAASQNPQIEGDLDRLFLKGAGNRSDSYFNVTRSDKDKNGKVVVDIDAGTLLGIEEGGLIAFYKKQATKLSGDENLVTIGDVTVADKFSSTVTLRDAPGEDIVIEDTKVVSVTPFFGKRKIKVFLGSPKSNKSKTFVDTLKTDLSKLQAFQLTTPTRASDDSARDWDLAVVTGKGRDFVKFGGAVEPSVQPTIASKDGFYITSPDGAPLFNLFVPADSPNAAEEIRSALEKRGRQESIRDFTNNASELTNAIDVSIQRAVKETKRPGRRSEFEFEALDGDNLTIPTFKIGDVFRLSIKNTSKDRLYVTGISLGADGSIQIVFPPPGGQDSLEPDATFVTPAIKVGGTTLGLETLKLIVTSQPVDLRTIEQPPAEVHRWLSANHRGAGGIKAILLMSMYKPDNSRSLTCEVESISDWTSKRIDYRVKKDTPK